MRPSLTATLAKSARRSQIVCRLLRIQDREYYRALVAERRHTVAQEVSPGQPARNGSESRREIKAPREFEIKRIGSIATRPIAAYLRIISSLSEKLGDLPLHWGFVRELALPENQDLPAIFLELLQVCFVALLIAFKL
jgi:hypothetical protein